MALAMRANVVDISVSSRAKKTSKYNRGVLAVKQVEKPIEHRTDALTTRQEVNDVASWLFKKAPSIGALFILAVNTGMRIGDTVGWRVCDFDLITRPEAVYILEQKTGKTRLLYLNDTVYKMVEKLIEKKGLSDDDYLFTSDAARKSYFVEWKYDKEGEIVDAVTSTERYNEDGTERKVAPISIRSVQRRYNDATKELNIMGHYSSHTARKTFSYFMSCGEYTQRNVTASAMALGHSDQRITEKHYTTDVAEEEVREAWLALNLGKEAVERW